ncbi:MAG: radical SAM-associated putative lipoprotein [Prevotella sp.]|nr:radical SAM-associated putative lipoprotein [Prevotella sp.]
MRKKLLHLSNKVLSALLVSMGFASCEDIIKSEDEYGTPTVDYHIVGKVTGPEGNPIKGIRVTARGFYDFNGRTQLQTFTDDEGKFATESIRDTWIDDGLRVVFEDVDGDDNGGKFAKDSLFSHELQSKLIEKGSGWFKGKYELTAEKQLRKEE